MAWKFSSFCRTRITESALLYVFFSSCVQNFENQISKFDFCPILDPSAASPRSRWIEKFSNFLIIIIDTHLKAIICPGSKLQRMWADREEIFMLELAKCMVIYASSLNSLCKLVWHSISCSSNNYLHNTSLLIKRKIFCREQSEKIKRKEKSRNFNFTFWAPFRGFTYGMERRMEHKINVCR